MAAAMAAGAVHVQVAAADVDSDDSEELLGAHRHAEPRAGLGRAAAAAAGLLMLGAVLLASRAAGAQSKDGGGSLRKGDASAALALSSAAELGKELFDANTEDFTEPTSADASPITNAPAEDLHDGNVCDDDEEMFGKLCYKKCSLLTSGKYPKRSSAWSCCAGGASGDKKCGLFDQKMSPLICSGFDVAGSRLGGGCPHPGGACLDNEEVALGRCYAKCSDLTDGEYPTRIAAATCCKSNQKWQCLNPMNVKTRGMFNVGGGKGDGDSRTPRGSHWPMRAVTESA